MLKHKSYVYLCSPLPITLSVLFFFYDFTAHKHTHTHKKVHSSLTFLMHQMAKRKSNQKKLHCLTFSSKNIHNIVISCA